MAYTYKNGLCLLRYRRYSIECAVHSIQTDTRSISQKQGMVFALLSLSNGQLKGPTDEDPIKTYAEIVFDEPLYSSSNWIMIRNNEIHESISKREIVIRWLL